MLGFSSSEPPQQDGGQIKRAGGYSADGKTWRETRAQTWHHKKLAGDPFVREREEREREKKKKRERVKEREREGGRETETKRGRGREEERK